MPRLRPIAVWYKRGEPSPPSEAVKEDAIRFLEEQGDLLSWADPDWPVVALYRVAERAFAAGSA